jgi:hypothetical protein
MGSKKKKKKKKKNIPRVVVIATLALIRAQLLVLMEVATVDYSVIHILEQ